MKSHGLSNSKGFTLVELAIVLVIIGLLIGGILVGQSISDSANVTATGKQLGEFDAAVGAFGVKYKGQLPGDSTFFPSVGMGDGDGAIESFSSNWGGGVFNGYMSAYQCEISNFWGQAMPDKFVSGGVCGTTAVLAVDGPVKTAPKPKIGRGNTAWLASSYGSPADIIPSPAYNYYSITLIGANSLTGGHYRLTPSSSGNMALKPIELAALDSKFDNGFANSGNIISATFAAGWGTPRLTANAGCSSGANYYVNTATYQCTPFFRMGTQTGNLK